MAPYDSLGAQKSDGNESNNTSGARRLRLVRLPDG
jgi:hypothetical protein